MFTLRAHARRGVRLAAIGAAAVACVQGAAQAYQQDQIYFDPGQTGGPTGSGSSGTLDPSTLFFNARLSPPDMPMFTGGVYADPNHQAYFTGDLVHFATVGGTVTVAPVTLTQMAIDVGGYTFNGGSITLGGGYQAYGNNAITDLLALNSGNATINSDIFMPNGGTGVFSNIKVATGSVLTIGNLTNGNYGVISKSGGGLLDITGTLTTPRTDGGPPGSSPAYAFQVNAGIAILHGNNNSVSVGDYIDDSGATVHRPSGVAAGAVLAGNARVASPAGAWLIAGTLAPGTVTASSNFGNVGTFHIDSVGQGASITMTQDAHLAVDLTTPDLNPDSSVNSGLHDVFKFTAGTYGTSNFTIDNGAKVDINGGMGTLQAGTYHIIQFAGSAGQYSIVNLLDGGLAVGSAPTGYTYQVIDLPGSGPTGGPGWTGGIDLVVTAVTQAMIDATWATNTDGNWSTAGNWTPGVPNSAGSIARFTGNGQASVTVDAAQTLGSIVITGATNYTIGGTAALTMDNTGGTGNAAINSAGGNQAINAPIVTTASNLDVSAAAGTLTLGGAISGSGNLNVAGAGTVVVSGDNSYGGVTSLNSGTLLVSNATGSATGAGTVTLNGGTLGGHGTIAGGVVAGSGPHTIAPSATLSPTSTGTLTVGSLTTSTSTTLAFNLNGTGASGSNDMIAAGTLTLNGGQVVVAHALTGSGSLGYYKILQYSGSILGSGISSLSAPADAPGNIVYSLDTAHNSGFVDLHRGFSGDANDDGSVTFADFVALSNHFGLSNAGWSGGDFNNDGTTNFADFVVLSNHFGLAVDSGSLVVSASDIAAFEQAAASFFASAPVPEPASLMLLGLGGVALLARRRRLAVGG